MNVKIVNYYFSKNKKKKNNHNLAFILCVIYKINFSLVLFISLKILFINSGLMCLKICVCFLYNFNKCQNKV